METKGRSGVWHLAAVVAGLVALAPLPSRAEAPAFGVGVGLGEMGTFGATLRFRAGPVGIEPGVGVLFYFIAVEDPWGDTETESGLVPVVGGQLAYFFTDRSEPSQHAVYLGASNHEIVGMTYAVGYRYERYFRGGRNGFHVGGGLNYAPDWKKKTEDFVREETGYANAELESSFYLPIHIGVGFHF